MFRLDINSEFYISDYQEGDQKDLILHMKEKQIYNQTLCIPFPYTQEDADSWVKLHLDKIKELDGKTTNWAIRQKSKSTDRDSLVGAIGFMTLKVGSNHKSELGYWLAKPYWNKGIMTKAVQKTVEYAFKEFGLVKITAGVFASNIGSAQVLEKNGFEQEGYLKLHYSKDGQLFDGKMYALLKK